MSDIHQPDHHLDAQESPQSSAAVFEEILKTRYRLVNEGLLSPYHNCVFNFNQRLCCAAQNMFVEKFSELGYTIDTGNQSIQRWTLLLYFLSLNSVDLTTQDIGLFTYLSSWNTGTGKYSPPLFIPRRGSIRVLSMGGDNSNKLYQNEFSQLYQQMATLSGPYHSDDQQPDQQLLTQLSTHIDAFIAKYGEATQHFDFNKLQELAQKSYMIDYAKKLQDRELAVDKPYKMQSLKIEQKVINELLQTMSANPASETVS